MALLELRDLRAYYQTEVYGISRTVRAVDDVSLTLQPNEIYGVAGESSCGKTTLIKVISGTIKPPLRVESGSVDYNFGLGKVDMLRTNQDELRANVRWKEISYVMQGSMSVLNPVRRIIRTFEDIVGTHQGIPDKRSFLEKTREHVRTLGLPPDVLNLFPHQLSGGMRQRVVLAMALALDPALLILDEPTTALDVVVQKEILQRVNVLRKQRGFGVLFITHDMPLLLEVADRVAVLQHGRLLDVGSPAALRNGPVQAYTAQLVRGAVAVAAPEAEVGA